MELDWEQTDRWCMDSDPPGFTISRCSMDDGWKIQAWHGSKHLLTTQGPEAVAECKAACERARAAA